MKELGYLDSLVLGALQGLTEFLPISSSAHLALGQRWLNLDPDAPTLLLFDALTHIGTLIAVGIVFRVPLTRFVATFFRQLRTLRDPAVAENSAAGRLSRPPVSRRSPPRRDTLSILRIVALAIVGSVPTAVIGLAFKDTFEAAFARPRWIGFCLLVTGVLLSILSRIPRGRLGWRQFTWWQAGLIGLAQAGAILPGISRSGATICMASYCGWRRRWAAEFSFLIAVPAILGGTLLKLRDTFALPAESFEAIPWGSLLVGATTALLVGVIALLFLLAAVRRAKLHYFAPYCWVLGLLVWANC